MYPDVCRVARSADARDSRTSRGRLVDIGDDVAERFPHGRREEPAVAAERTDVGELAGVGPAADRTVADTEEHGDLTGRQERVLTTVAVLHRDRLPTQTLDETLTRPAGVWGLPHVDTMSFLPKLGGKRPRGRERWWVDDSPSVVHCPPVDPKGAWKHESRARGPAPEMTNARTSFELNAVRALELLVLHTGCVVLVKPW